MKKRIPYFKKVSLYMLWRKTILSKKNELLENFNTRVDGAHRIYTVINLPPELIEEPYNLRKSDIDVMAQTYIKEYASKISVYLNSNNLIELYDYYEVKKVEKYSYLVVFGFSLLKTHIFLRNLTIGTICASVATLISLLIFFL
jgi:hypothetical protein